MPIILDLQGVQSSQVTVQPSPLAELMSVLHMLAEANHHVDQAAEIRHIDQVMPRTLKQNLKDLAPLWARFRVRSLMPLTHHPSAGFEHDMQRLESLELQAFVTMAAEAIYGARSSSFTNILTDESEARSFVARADDRSESRGSLANLLVNHPEDLRSRLITVLLEAHQTFFSSRWAECLPALRSMQSDVQAMLKQQPFAVVLTALNPGIHYFPSTNQVAFDKLQNAFVPAEDRHYIIVPSYYTRPHTIVKYDAGYGRSAQDLPIVIQVPIHNLAVGTRASVEEIQHRLTVLADPARLNLVRHLIYEECTTTELARLTGMTIPQVSRHLRRLREAGLLRSERDGRMIRNRINLRTVYALGYDLVTGVMR